MSTRPRIGVFITLAEPGGAQTFVRSLLPALLDRFEPFVAAHGTSGPVVDACRELGVPYEHLRHLRRDLNPVEDIMATLEIASVLRRRRPSLIQINSSKAGIVARVAARIVPGVRTVFTAHGWAFSGSADTSTRMFVAAERVAGALSDAIVCVSRYDLRLADSFRIGRPSRRHVIHNGIGELLPLSAPAPGPFKIVSVGRLQEQKDHFSLIEAAARLKRDGIAVRVDIVGEGPDRDAITQAIGASDAAGYVKLLGNRRDVPELLRTSDLFVLSSRWEGLPYSILEAMACGMPVVASAVGGVPELVVDDVTGYLVPPQDATALSDAIRDVATRPDRGRPLGAAGRDLVRRRFSIERMQDRYLALFDELLDERSRRGSALAPAPRSPRAR